MYKSTEVQRHAGRIEELIRKLEVSADAESLATARALVQSIMELYSAGLDRLTEIVAGKGVAGLEILDECGRDELVGNLLAANGLHPLDLETRVRRALEKLSTRLKSQGGVDLVGIDQGIIRLRLRSSGSGCGSSAGALESQVRDAMYQAAPDLTEVVIEVVEDRGAASGFVPLEKLVGATAHGSTSGASNGRGAGV
jgi:Fe-S cluster biogenesis protein NfuA